MDYPKSLTDVDLYEGKFTDGTADGSIPPSRDPAKTTNDIIDSILLVQDWTGEAPDEDDTTQLKRAIDARIAEVVAGIDLPDAAPSTLGRHTIFVPAGAMVANSSNGAALYNAAPNGGANTIKGWSFSDAADQSVCFGVWMPKSWDRTLLHVRLAWLRLGATAGAVKFKFEALARTHAGAVAHSFAGAATTSAVSVAQDAGQHCETVEIALDLTGAPESAWIDLRVTRMASDTAADTLAEAAIVIGHDVFYTTATVTDD